jgi:hypothetical protein
MYYPDYLRQCSEVRLLLKDNGITFRELTTVTGYKIFEFDDEADRFFFLLTYRNAKTFDPIYDRI